MEVPRLGVEPEMQLWAYVTATAMWDPSHICDLHHSSQQWQILNPLSEPRDRICILIDISRVHNPLSFNGKLQIWSLFRDWIQPSVFKGNTGPREVEGLCRTQHQLGAALGQGCPGLVFPLPGFISLMLMTTLDNLLIGANQLIGESILSVATARWSLIKHKYSKSSWHLIMYYINMPKSHQKHFFPHSLTVENYQTRHKRGNQPLNCNLRRCCRFLSIL